MFFPVNDCYDGFIGGIYCSIRSHVFGCLSFCDISIHCALYLNSLSHYRLHNIYKDILILSIYQFIFIYSQEYFYKEGTFLSTFLGYLVVKFV